MQPEFHLAQVNIAKALAPLDQPVMQGFVAQLDHINALADRSSGFVWRLQGEQGDATDVQLFDDPLIIVNLSVWTSLEALQQYVYTGEHVQLLRDRKQWFEKPDRSPLALWWVPAGHIPTGQEARQRLEQLWRDGSTPQAFSFAKPFSAEDSMLASAASPA